jgi:plasmid maintenance system killer protein
MGHATSSLRARARPPNGKWQVTFRFVESDVELVDYQGYH